jgi:ABC-type tungstate transport system permease subunit
MLVAALALLALPTLSRADTSSTLTIVGTSDVSDSGLMPNLIIPQFHAAYPQFALPVYDGNATLAAIDIAENETGNDYNGSSVLIVHAASLENQFVAGGYSMDNQYGIALFTNDFVLAGAPSTASPAGDPAGVAANAAHNMVQAFEDVATAGYNSGGTPLATFVSRGNGSGTTVEEHEIWQLVGEQTSLPPGLLLCALPASLGGGETPVASGQVAAQGDACPSNGGNPPSGTQVPTWYVTTGANQGKNVQDADTCSYSTGANTCYVFSDRGTYDYLKSGTDPAGDITNLTILSNQNSSTAPGGQYLLTNYFHGYVINPNESYDAGQVNVPAAQDFLNFVTSPTVQAELATYLPSIDPEGPPFVADASPIITDSGIPGTDPAGMPVTVTGTVVNAEPGYPALSGKAVAVDEIEGGLPVPVASGTTNSSGGFSVSFVPPSSGSYQVTTGQITQIENDVLDPVFGDQLSPAASAATSMGVQGAVSILAANPTTGGANVVGNVAPAAPDANATVTISARPQGSTGAFSPVGSTKLAAGAGAYALNVPLGAGTRQIEATYADGSQLGSATSGAASVTIPASTTTTPPSTRSASTVSYKSVKVKKGALTVTGTVSRAPTAKGAVVELFGLKTVKVKVNKAKSKKKGKKASAAAASFPKVGSGSVAVGKRTFTIHAKLKRGYRWVLQLEYVRAGQTSSFSKLRSIDVH